MALPISQIQGFGNNRVLSVLDSFNAARDRKKEDLLFDQAQQDRKAQQAEAMAQQQRQIEIREELKRLSKPGITADEVNRSMIANPELKDVLKMPFENLERSQKETRKAQMMGIHAAIVGGNPDVAEEQFDRLIDAAENSNDPQFAKLMEFHKDNFKRDPEAYAQNAQMVLGAIMEPDEFLDYDAKVRKMRDEKEAQIPIDLKVRDVQSEIQLREAQAEKARAEANAGPKKSESEAKRDRLVAMGYPEELATKISDGVVKVVTDPVTGGMHIVDEADGTSRPVNSVTVSAIRETTPVDDSISEGPSLNLYESIGADMTGVVASAKEKLQRTAGQFVNVEFESPDIQQVRETFKTQQKELVRAMKQGDKFTVGEMNAIEKEIDIQPSAWKDEQTLKNQFKSIDRSLRNRLVNQRRIIKDDNSTVKQIQQSIETATAIEDFLRNLNVPQSESSQSVPEGLTAEEWDVMPEEDKALWQN